MSRDEILTVDGHTMRVCVGTPSGTPKAGILVMCHGPGVDRFVADRVDALAEHGYLAAAPDVFHRQPADDDVMARIGKLRDDEIIADADATLSLFDGPDSPPNPKVAVAVLGFCMGGRNTYLLAGARPQRFFAAGVFYGGNIFKAWGDGPSPFDRTPQIACPILGIFGAEDTNPSPEDVKRLDAALTEQGKVHDFHMYDGAGHAFLNFTNPERYRATQAADAWTKLLAWLDSLAGGA
jgi:carboxymethylenebutenolidase